MVRRDNMFMACGVNGIHNPIKETKLLSSSEYWLDSSNFVIFKGFFILIPEGRTNVLIKLPIYTTKVKGV